MEKIWLKSYPEGVPAELPDPPFRSVRDLFEQAFDAWPDRPAFTNMGTTLTYRELDELSMQFARFLQQELGMTRGERLAIMLPNVLQYPVALCGAFRAGLVVVNVNPLYTRRELQHQLADCGARCIVVLENFAHTLEKAIDETAIEHVVTTGVGDLLRFPRGAITNLFLRYIKRSVPAYDLPGSFRFKAALKAGQDQGLSHVEIGFADIAFLQYTGGTTGVAKGAMLSHRNMVRNVQQTVLWLGDAYAELSQLVAITALPLYHIFSLQANCLITVAQGGENVLITNPRDMKSFVAELRRRPFHFFSGVNTMFAALCNAPGFDEVDFSELRICIGGGMAVHAAVNADWEKITGCTIVQGYGLTETSPIAVANIVGSPFTGSIGLPVSGTEVMICDEEGIALPLDEVGEICIRGPQVMEGYWQRPQETANVMLPGGWLKTGDMGRMKPDGYIFIEDRKKDMILVSGFNVYPNEIESVAVEMKGVLEAAAIGVEDERSGEIVKLFVVRSDPSITEQDVMDHCKANLTNYKRPRIIEFRDELPKTNVGKILRRALRDETTE